MGAQGVVAEERLSPTEATALTDQIRGAISRTLDSMADVEHAVTQAYDARAWAALGYSSWETYCAAEFSETRLWATVEERQARTLSLREAGMSQRAIAAVLGVGKGTTDRDLGAVSGAPSGAPDRAVPSTVQLVGTDGVAQPSTKAVTHELVERRLEVARLSEDGLSQEQIASRVGVSQATVSNDLHEVGVLEAHAPEQFTEIVANPVLGSREVLDAFEHLTLPSVNLGDLTANALRDLELDAKFLYENIVMADEWVEPSQRKAAVAAFVPKIGDALLILLSALGEISVDDLPQDEQLLLRWSHTVGRVRAELDKVVTT